MFAELEPTEKPEEEVEAEEEIETPILDEERLKIVEPPEYGDPVQFFLKTNLNSRHGDVFD